jgi:hypothetical protein
MPEQKPAPDPEESLDRVTRVTRGALEGAASGRAVPPALVRALAEGQGTPSEVADLSRQLFGAGAKPLDLVLFDTDRIASFVFESSRPPVLAGASKILRELNAGIAESYREQTIFSGGGEGLLLVPAGRGADVCEQIRRRFASQTGGALGVTVAFLPVAPEEFLSSSGEEDRAVDGARLVSGTQAVLARLRDQVRAEKDRRLPARRQVAGDRARCVSCRDREAGPAECPRRSLDGQAEGRLCEPCRLRWEEGRRRVIAGDSFEDLVERFRQAIGGAPGAKSSYLGFLYADGNAMGNLFGRLRSLSELRFASTAVGHVFEAAASEVEKEVCKVTEERIFLSLLGGGDEAIWILPGALAVRVAEQLATWIDRAAGAIPGLAPLLQAAGTPKLTFGAGLVLCDLGFPVRYQHELASALLKNAKGMFHGVDRSRISSSIDFAVLTDSSPLSEDLASARALSYRTAEKRFLRTCRPYTYDGFAELLKTARRAKEAKLGKSQLYALQSGATEGRKVFLNHLRYQIARKPAGPRYQAWMEGTAFADPGGIERFFLRDLPGEAGTQGTWIPDLLELSPFLDLLECEA